MQRGCTRILRKFEALKDEKNQNFSAFRLYLIIYTLFIIECKDINNNSHFIILVGQRHGLCFPTRQKICIWRQIIKRYAHHFLTQSWRYLTTLSLY